MGLLSGIGGFFGSRAEGKGFREARGEFGQLLEKAPEIQERIDPFSKYRGDLAARLEGIVTGREDFRTDPGYQFRLGEGIRETERAAAARGLNVSGNVMAAIQQRGQDVAAQEYGNIINRLMALSGATPQASIAGGQAYADALTTGYTGRAAAEVGGGQARAAGIGSLWGGIESGASGFMSSGIKGLF